MTDPTPAVRPDAELVREIKYRERIATLTNELALAQQVWDERSRVAAQRIAALEAEVTRLRAELDASR